MIQVQMSSVIALSMLCASAALAEPENRSAEHQRAADVFLEDARTTDAISRRVGTRIRRCVDTTVGLELCQWILRDREAGWEELAHSIRTRARVVVLCEVPKDVPRDGSSRKENRCSASPRKSNRSLFRPPVAGPKRKRAGLSRMNSGHSREENRRIAQSWIDEARTLLAMSHLMGAIPSVCEPPSEGERLCIWRTTKQTYGHGTVAASIKADSSKKVRLHCKFPIDGSERRAESCVARVGA